MTKNQLNDLVEYLKSLGLRNMTRKVTKIIMDQRLIMLHLCKIRGRNHEKTKTEQITLDMHNSFVTSGNSVQLGSIRVMGNVLQRQKSVKM